MWNFVNREELAQDEYLVKSSCRQFSGLILRTRWHYVCAVAKLLADNDANRHGAYVVLIIVLTHIGFCFRLSWFAFGKV